MIFIGIDLAWTNKNETGICIMDDSGKVLRHEAAVFSDEDLVAIIKSYEGHSLCVGIDGPVVVNNETGSRGPEGAMMRDTFHGHRLRAFNTNRQYMIKTFGTIRGENIFMDLKKNCKDVRHLSVHARGEIRVMEVFPTGSCLGLFPDLYPLKYKVKAKVPLSQAKKDMERLIQRVKELEEIKIIKGSSSGLEADLTEIKVKAYKHLEDKLDAFLCAYSMFSVYSGRAEQRLYGSEDVGLIMVPVTRL